MIDILIPTFNRAKDIEKNLDLLVKQITMYRLNEKISISISDNASEDETAAIVQKFVDAKSVHINYYQQEENVGLEKNVVFLLEKSRSPYIMYLGDDDFIPDDYLQYLIERINEIDSLTCIIPGFSALYRDGTVKTVRYADYEEKIFQPSFKTVRQISQYGHQLSGLLLKRENLYKNYTAFKHLRNLYPFIFFVAYNLLQGTSIYAPKYKVLVSQDNSKDWNYDDSGLLTEVFKNYKILYPNAYMKRNIMNFVFMYNQSWRLRVGKNVKYSYKAFMHLEKNEYIDLLTKLLLPLLYSYFYGRIIFSKIKRTIFW